MLAVQFVAMLHQMARLDVRLDPGVSRARDLQTSLRAALAKLALAQPQPL